VPRYRLNPVISEAQNRYGSISRLKLTPAASMAIISLLSANLTVKKITDIKTNKAEKRFE
jgi:hypothetical protein